MPKEWYVVHTYSGYENKVKVNIARWVESMGMQDKIFQVVVPVEEQIEFKDGKKKIVKKKIFPGYILVQMEMDDDLWYLVRKTPGVTGFVGSGSKPISLQEEEIEEILRQIGVSEPKQQINLNPGETVRVTDGPFENLTGIVETINNDRGKVRVLISMFGRETPIELNFSQVEKME
jgi:transcriptional antiterminator NusG